MIRSNTRTGTRTTRTVTIILLVSWIFVISYSPFPLFTALEYYKITNAPWIGILSLYLSSANLIINPFVYFFVCPRFRSMFTWTGAEPSPGGHFLSHTTTGEGAGVLLTRPVSALQLSVVNQSSELNVIRKQRSISVF